MSTSTIADPPTTEPVTAILRGPPRAVAPPVPPPGWQRRPDLRKSQPAVDVRSITSKLQDVFVKARAATAAFEAQIRPALDAAPPSRACEEHPEVILPLDRARSFDESWTQEDGVRLVYETCPACRDEAAAWALRDHWARRGVPERVLDATFENFDASGDKAEAKTQALSKARAFACTACTPVRARDHTSARRGGFLLLVGTTGTGKGHLAVGVMKALGWEGQFITQADLLTGLRASYQTHTTEAFIERCKETPCLIVDEFGLSVGGKDEGPMLYQILAHRHDMRLPTIISSNEELADLKKALGFRLVDRIREDYAVIVCKWASYRTRESAQ